MAFFVGEFEQTIDTKHRVAIASALRDCMDPELDGEKFYLVLGADRHLWLYPDRYYAKLMSKIRRSKLPVKKAQGFAMMLATARVVKPDGQGRIVLPEKSMERAVVADKATLIGQDDHIEIWPTDEWNKQLESGMSSYGQLLREAAELMVDDDEDDQE